MKKNKFSRILIGFIVLLICAYSANAQQVSGVNKFQTGVTYNVDDLVSSSGVIYKALLQNATMPPNDNWVSFVTLDDLPPSTNPLPLNYSVNWTGTGLVFNAAALRYYIVNTYSSATAAEITLNTADATNDRIDLIVADTSGVISKITGTPAPSPAEPNYDLETQFPLKFILVAAGGTVPDGISNTLIYDENLQESGGEWDTSGLSDFNSTTEAYSGVKSIDTSISNFSMIFQNSTGFVFKDLVNISIWLKLDTAWTNKYAYIYVNLSNQVGGTGISIYYDLNLSGFDTSSTDWQNIIIPKSEFSGSESLVIKTISYHFYPGNNYHTDLITIQTDTSAPTTPPTDAYAPLSHVSNYTNPHQVTKTQVGLSNVPNTDFTTAVGLNTAKITESTSVTDTSEIDLTLTGTAIKGDLGVASIDETKLDASVNVSLNLADSALQSFTESDPVYTADPAFSIVAQDITNLGNLSNTNTGDNAVNSLYSSLVTNQTHTGDVTGATALTIAVDAVDIPMLSATGTADATTYLRGDNTWATAGGGGGDVFKVGTPVNNQIGVWTGDGTLEGTTGFTNDGTTFVSTSPTTTLGTTIGKIQAHTDILFEIDYDNNSTSEYRFTNGIGNDLLTLGETSIMELGRNDVEMGDFSLFGDAGGNGGRITLYNAGSFDSDNEYFDVNSVNGDFIISGVTDGNILNYDASVNELNIYGGAEITVKETTSTTLDLGSIGGNLVSMGTANTATTYTITGAVPNGYAQVRINAASEPTVTGGTKTAGATFAASTDMHLVVWYNGTTTQYYFLEI